MKLVNMSFIVTNALRSVFQVLDIIFFKWAIPGLFFFIFIFYIVQLVDKILPMSGFEPPIYFVRIDRSTN